MEITFSIIGTSGGKRDISKLSLFKFKAMCLVAEELLLQFEKNNYPISHVITGGNAWADHVAVKLFLEKKVPHLRLFVPVQWHSGEYMITQAAGAYKNAGEILNYHHRRFSKIVGFSSLYDINSAIREGAELIYVSRGFHACSALIAKSDFLLTMTYGEENMVSGFIAENITRKYLERVRKENFFDKSYHYNLNDGKIYVGCNVPPKSEHS